MKRITRDQALMCMAWIASQRGTCGRLQVGALIAFDSRPISIGYTGAPSGFLHCGDHCDLSKPCTRTIHAEANAIEWAMGHGLKIKGSTLYTTDSPCQECAELILDRGITRVVYDRQYRLTEPLEFLEEFGVEVSRCEVSNGR